ncbi:uncharacterized protein LOC114332316 [Diabrotica virgifera virgifera]|nr:uncharacterized protein LOC114332316 [Diabrotica virgifera virgifera]
MSYFKTHYGHETDMKHMRLSKIKRESVASKLIAGVSVSHILNSTRDNIGCAFKRDHLLTRMDINNVMRSYNIGLKNGCRHKQDAVSVELWVQEISGTENNPVKFHKRQNSECTAYNLENNDICLILMSPVQAELLKKFGQNLICVDSTHGLNAYDFEMTTVLVVDEFGNGFPVAFLFSNRKDSYINEVYFTEIRKVTGKIQTLNFMSDITSVFYLPWQTIMGTPIKQLYCSWHIDRAWQQNLGKISDLDKRKWVYKSLKHVQGILDEDKFTSDFNNLLNLLLSDDETKKMGEYVKTYYGKNVEQWAYCYRKNCPANTNMHLEAMHKTIKHVYLDGKKISMDKTLHCLQRFIRDKTLERIIKITKDKKHHHCNMIFSRHRAALTLELKNIEVSENREDSTYYIKTADDLHIISKKQLQKCCHLVCTSCDICIHMYECSCIEYAIKLTICKHIHFVCLNFKKSKVKVNKNEQQCENLDKETEVTELLQNFPSSTICVADKRKEATDLAFQLIEKLKSDHLNIDQLDLITKHLKVAASVGSLSCAQQSAEDFTIKLEEDKSMPSNKKIEKQAFFSTRKKMKAKNANEETRFW